MVDLILAAFTVGVAYLAFRAGAKYQTLATAYTALKDGIARLFSA